MKKIISLVSAICIMITGATIGGSAAEFVDSNTNTFYYGNKEVSISDENISQEKMHFIADYIIGESITDVHENSVSPCGIACIFGHKIETTTATETEHNAYSSSPKCLVKKYKIEYCTRSSCDYINKELISSYRTAVCHG